MTFILIHSSEVSFQESFNGEQYLVRNLEDKNDAANMLSDMKSKLKKLINIVLNLFDIGIEKESRLIRMKNSELLIRDFGLLNYLEYQNMRLQYI